MTRMIVRATEEPAAVWVRMLQLLNRGSVAGTGTAAGLTVLKIGNKGLDRCAEACWNFEKCVLIMIFCRSIAVGFATGIGALAISLPAHALTFHWSFENTDGAPAAGGTTSGTITGLSEGNNDLTSLGITLNVISAQNLPPFSFASGPSNTGFIQVTTGKVVDYNFVLKSTPYEFVANFAGAGYAIVGGVEEDVYFGSRNIFDPVPGPLPVLGASAAFAWTRRIRRRISLAAVSTDSSRG